MRLSKGLGLFTVMRARVVKNPMPIPQTHLRRERADKKGASVPSGVPFPPSVSTLSLSQTLV